MNNWSVHSFHLTIFVTIIMKIYTKSGDGGSSSLYNGERRDKTNRVFHALGDCDELSSLIGIAREFVAELAEHDKKCAIASTLEWVQSRLLDVGSCIATPPTSSEARLRRTEFNARHTQVLEDRIDELDAELPSLTMFILPSGGMAASHLHLARCVCRRAERSTVALDDDVDDVDDVDDGKRDTSLASVKTFLNRLSDYLFTAARMCAVIGGRPEVTYRKTLEE